MRQWLGLDEVNWLPRDGSVLTFAVKSDKSMDSKLLRKLIHVPDDYCDSPFHPLRQCDYLSFCETDKLSSTNSLKIRKLDEYLQIFHDPSGKLGVESVPALGGKSSTKKKIVPAAAVVPFEKGQRVEAQCTTNNMSAEHWGNTWFKATVTKVHVEETFKGLYDIKFLDNRCGGVQTKVASGRIRADPAAEAKAEADREKKRKKKIKIEEVKEEEKDDDDAQNSRLATDIDDESKRQAEELRQLLCSPNANRSEDSNAVDPLYAERCLEVIILKKLSDFVWSPYCIDSEHKKFCSTFCIGCETKTYFHRTDGYSHCGGMFNFLGIFLFPIFLTHLIHPPTHTPRTHSY